MKKPPPPPPTFVISAVNRYAAGVVRSWCVVSQKNGTAGLAEIEEAYAIAVEMEDWFIKYGENP